ncbi:MAG: 2Fe-2S iron-sulfur cluster-binding protein [Methylohalobius sp.]|nr:2Fe-2S iron-sulfur cluster-binding protein [Methylohalobius sp.]
MISHVQAFWRSFEALWLASWPQIALGVSVFVAVVVLLTSLILLAKAWIVPSGTAKIRINDEHTLEVPVGGKLLSALASQGIYLPSACGGKGICGQGASGRRRRRRPSLAAGDRPVRKGLDPPRLSADLRGCRQKRS